MTDIQSYSFVGEAGFFLYLPCVLLCIVRTILSFYDEKWKFTIKPIFHVCVTVYYLLDLLYYIDLWEVNDVMITAWIEHEIALFFNLEAFSIVVLFWADSLNGGATKISNWVIGIFLLVNFIILLTALIVFTLNGLECGTNFCITIFSLELSSNGVCIFLVSLWMLLLGVSILRRVGHNIDRMVIISILDIRRPQDCYISSIMNSIGSLHLNGFLISSLASSYYIL